MSLASFQLVIESIQIMVSYASKSGNTPTVNFTVILIAAGTVGKGFGIRFLAPLAEGQRAIVMAWGRRVSVRPFVRACVRKLFL